ncbi:recombinase RecT [Flavitalea antarctica]
MSTTNQTPATQAAQTPAQSPKRFEESTIDKVLERITSFQTSGDLMMPANYSPENAVRAAWLVLQETYDLNKKPALEVCTPASVSTALLEMVLKGLSVVKKQGYFIVYGNKLVFEESYIGTMAIARREANVKDVVPVVIYEGDEFEYKIDHRNGRKEIIKHIQVIENCIPEKIKGAYAIVEFQDGTTKTEIMTIAQIRNAWSMGGAKGNSPAHNKFPDQMACKTVINRALKLEIGSSDDSALFEDQVAATVKHEIKTNANKQSIGFDKDPKPQDKPKINNTPPPQLKREYIETEMVAEESSNGVANGPDF